MPRALRITFTFLSPDKCLISLFMTREVSILSLGQGPCACSSLVASDILQDQVHTA